MDDIGMEYGLDKAAKVTRIGGKLQQRFYFELDTEFTIKKLDLR